MFQFQLTKTTFTYAIITYVLQFIWINDSCLWYFLFSIHLNYIYLHIYIWVHTYIYTNITLHVHSWLHAMIMMMEYYWIYLYKNENKNDEWKKKLIKLMEWNMWEEENSAHEYDSERRERQRLPISVRRSPNHP